MTRVNILTPALKTMLDFFLTNPSHMNMLQYPDLARAWEILTKREFSVQTLS